MSARDNISEVYDYRDDNNGIAYQTVRYVPKSFRHRRLVQLNNCTNVCYIWGLSQGYYYRDSYGDYYRSQDQCSKLNNTLFLAIKNHYPYHLQKMFQSDTIILAEGEKDVHTLESLSIVATTNSGGAGSFTQDIIHYFKDKNVVILTDNDQPGYRGSLKRAKLLYGEAKNIKIVPPFPQSPHHGDVTEWIERTQNTSVHKLTKNQKIQVRKELTTIVQNTPIWTPNIVRRSNISKKLTQSTQTPLNILSLLKDVRQKTSSTWTALCPGHDDQHHSLSIRRTDTRYLLHCFAGCSIYQITDALNISTQDLFIT